MSNAIIPETTIVARYVDMKKMRQSDRLATAKRDCANGGKTLGAIFRDSVAEFARYENLEPFRDARRKDLPEPAEELHTTLQVAAHVQAAGEMLGMRLVDREIVAARTKLLRPTHTEQGVTLVRNDLLLRGRDGQPVIGEVKTRTDSDGYYALIQLLACAAQLATPNQRARLAAQPGYQLDADLPIDLVHFTTAHEPAAATYKPDLDDAGEALASALMASDSLGPDIGTISRVELDVKDGTLRAKRLWSY